MVVTFGVVSLLADMVYEGARSVYGPLLAFLGAGAVLVGVITGAGEAMALLLRLVFGPLADRTGRYWVLTISGYGLTALAVPLLAVTPFVGAAGLALATGLILLERSGKAIRSPAKTALLAQASHEIGRGRGFGVHKAMDQVGAFAGPLSVAAVVAVFGGVWTGMVFLAVPGFLAMAVLVWLRMSMPDVAGDSRPAVSAAAAPTENRSHPAGSAPRAVSRETRRRWLAEATGGGLPGEFFRYAVAVGVTTGGLVTFGLIGYHLTVRNVIPVSGIPVLYAGAMLVEAVAAVVVGMVYDRLNSRVLYAVPVFVAMVPGLALSDDVGLVVAGILAWGAAAGIQDSTIKALVADLVDPERHATAYGVFAAIQGATAIAGGALIGWLYAASFMVLVLTVAVGQLTALVVLVSTLRLARQARGRSDS